MSAKLSMPMEPAVSRADGDRELRGIALTKANSEQMFRLGDSRSKMPGVPAFRIEAKDVEHLMKGFRETERSLVPDLGGEHGSDAASAP